MARLAETAQMSEWIAKDDDFQLEQERRRAAIRLKDKRAKAVDFLALNLKYASPNYDDEADEEQRVLDDAGLDIDLDEPYTILEVRCLDEIALASHRPDRTSRLSKSKSCTKTFNATLLSKKRTSTSSFGR